VSPSSVCFAEPAGGYPFYMADELPRDLSRLRDRDLAKARAQCDERVTKLFRRWPGLTKEETRELRKTYAESVRLAKHIGRLRRSRSADD
jgi:hypothetical protein